MDTANEELSKCLNEVLDDIGASEDIRRECRENALLLEIQSTFECHVYDESSEKRSMYVVGSMSEGSTTTGLNSDSDFLHCHEGTPVVENLKECKHQGLFYLMLTDENTKPGYVRLQVVVDKFPLTDERCFPDDICFEIDHNFKVCLKNTELFIGRPTFRNGPAETLIDNYPMDYVHALRCQHIPSSANTWLHRTREYDWPSQKQLKAMIPYGCFLVGVGHPHSDLKSIEWRVSFTLQERDLMSSLNETQHKCYILLKMIKKDFIEPKAGESISSYHCKSSLFYTIENSHRHFWTDDKLILCVQKCLKRLLYCVKANECPNFFIPKENMFDKLSPQTLKNVEYVLKDIIDRGVNFLYTLNCDKVGELLKSRMCSSKQVGSLGNTSTIIEVNSLLRKVHASNARGVYSIRTTLLVRMHMSSYIHTCTSYLTDTNQLLHYLQITNEVTEHTQEDVRIALDSIIPHIKLQKQQCLFAKYLTREDMPRQRSKTIPNVISDTNDCDLISSKLSLASLYIISEQQHSECERILVSCVNSLTPCVISVCMCEPFNIVKSNVDLAEKQQLTKMSSKDFRRDFITGCMLFHPSQVSLVHAALHYEMFRNVYTKPESVEFLTYWLNWITVDSKIYQYFLQYLLYSKTEKCTEKERAVQNLWHVLKTDPNLGHRETGFNLLGWICSQEENSLQDAWRFFCVSWKIRPFNNAAKWHMAALLSGLRNGK